MFHSVDHLKLALASVVGLVAALTDVAADVHGWEDVSLKVLLILALIFIGRLFLQQQQDHKADVKDHKGEVEKIWAAHKEDAEKREIKYLAAIEANKQCLQQLVALTEEQTIYFKTVTRTVVDEKLNNKKPQLPG